jgi:hypothetical protein
MGHFLGFFRGALYLFDPKSMLLYAQDNLGVKKVFALPPCKKPLEMPQYMFCPRKKKLSPALTESAEHY